MDTEKYQDQIDNDPVNGEVPYEPAIYLSAQDLISLYNHDLITKEEIRAKLGFKEETSTD